MGSFKGIYRVLGFWVYGVWGFGGLGFRVGGLGVLGLGLGGSWVWVSKERALSGFGPFLHVLISIYI